MSRSRFKGVHVNPLPDTLWELLELALNDLEKAEKTPGVQVSMETWISPVANELAPVHGCMVCLAGALLINTGGIDWRASWDKLILEDVPLKVQHKMLALDMLRKGRVASAAEVLKRSPELEKARPEIYGCYIPMYSEKPKEFKAALRKLTKQLKAAGV